LPSEKGQEFLRLLDEAAHGPGEHWSRVDVPVTFVDEYLLPKLEAAAANGWPDWAVVWSDRVWMIELKTEAGSHRPDQLSYYLQLAAAAHPSCSLDLTYITGPLKKPAPELVAGQRYSHLTWGQVLPLVEEVWGRSTRPEVADYVQIITALVNNLGTLRPSQQRDIVIGGSLAPAIDLEAGFEGEDVLTVRSGADFNARPNPVDLLQLARETAIDGRQRGVGACDPEELEALRDQARAAIMSLAAEDVTRFVLPWLWQSDRTDGRALTAEGEEFGYELRFSRYKSMQVRPS